MMFYFFPKEQFLVFLYNLLETLEYHTILACFENLHLSALAKNQDLPPIFWFQLQEYYPTVNFEILTLFHLLMELHQWSFLLVQKSL